MKGEKHLVTNDKKQWQMTNDQDREQCALVTSWSSSKEIKVCKETKWAIHIWDSEGKQKKDKLVLKLFTNFDAYLIINNWDKFKHPALKIARISIHNIHETVTDVNIKTMQTSGSKEW